MAVLQVIRGHNVGTQYELANDRSVLGRHPECDIVLDVGAISREHAQIVRVNKDWFVEDLKSRNGTFVNGRMVSGRHPLRENDQLKICDLLFSFHHEQPGLLPPRAVTTTPNIHDSAIVIDDAGGAATTIMSSYDTSRTALQVGVNPEMKLKALLEITRNLGSAIAMEQVLPKVLDSLFKVFVQADRGFVVLLGDDGKTLIPKAVKHRRPGAEDVIRISRTVVEQVIGSREAILSADAATDSRFDTSQSIADFRIRSMMCAPLLGSEGHALGVIQIDTLDQRSRFQQDDLDVLASVACQAAVAVENAQLHEAAMDRRALERDLHLAHIVQQGILPSAPPRVPGYEFFDYYDPAQQVGGDYFDYVSLPNGRLAVILADVSGKGVPAALLMAKLSSEARYCLVSEADPASAMNRLNAVFQRGGWEDRFVTTIMAVLDLNQNEITIANAGHMAPLLRHADGRVEAIGDDCAGVPLGVDADCTYHQFCCKLEPGDLLTVFTDGISEAMNERGDLYSIDRLESQLQGAVSGAVALGNRVLSDVKQFVGTRAQSDDMCLICFGRPAA
ncbi:MAG TPA: SpoIIE family protein phosphatase [Pirellulales bacterium]|jgi:serine phosphatase RsbU (regulator of sigma subunit)|nr:SpoIIE family protein phosphatase [Pirellulales bacterium]